MAGTNQREGEENSHVFFIYEVEDKADLEALFTKLREVNLYPIDYLKPDKTTDLPTEKKTKELLGKTRIVVTYLRNGINEATPSRWCKELRNRVSKVVKKEENFLPLTSSDLFGDKLEFACERIKEAHRTGKAGSWVYLNCGQYNFLRIHMLLTTVGKTALQYLLQKRLCQFLGKKALKDVKGLDTCPTDLLSCTTEISKCQSDCVELEKLLELIRSLNATSIVLDEQKSLLWKLDDKKRLKKALEGIKSLYEDTNKGFESCKLKAKIIELCVQQKEQSTSKNKRSGIVNEATDSLKALIPVFEKAMEDFKESREVCLPLEITLTYTLLKSASLLRDFVLKNPQKSEGERTGVESDGSNGQGSLTRGSGGQSISHTAQEPEGPWPSLGEDSSHSSTTGAQQGETDVEERKKKEDKAATDIYWARNEISHLESIGCITEEQYQLALDVIYSRSKELVDDNEDLLLKFATMYKDISILGQQEMKLFKQRKPRHQPVAFKP